MLARVGPSERAGGRLLLPRILEITVPSSIVSIQTGTGYFTYKYIVFMSFNTLPGSLDHIARYSELSPCLM